MEDETDGPRFSPRIQPRSDSQTDAGTRFGGKKVGSIRKIRVAGSNGTAVIIRDDVVRMIYARLPEGVQCDVAIYRAGGGNARRCGTGLTIPEKCKQFGIGNWKTRNTDLRSVRHTGQ